MNPPITTRPARCPWRGLLLKAAVVIPDLIIASLLWLVIIALLPPAIGFMTVVGCVTSGALVAGGIGEDAVVRVLYRARRPNASEASRLDAAWRIASQRVDAEGVRLRIVAHGPTIATVGRQHVVLRRDVAAAHCANQITAHQVAALIAQGIGRLHQGHTRFDLLWKVWTIPWDLVRGLARALGRRLAWIPLVPFAWRIRFVVGTIAVVLEAEAGRWPSPIVLALLLALSYLVPHERDAWEQHLRPSVL